MTYLNNEGDILHPPPPPHAESGADTGCSTFVGLKNKEVLEVLEKVT